MKNSIILFLIFCSIQAIGQEKLNIEINNPEPRVEQKVTFSFKLNFFIDYIIDELGPDVEYTNETSFGEIQSDAFERIIQFKEVKKHKIGPFEFEFNGKKYITNTIELNVIPKLPLENGLWLRIVEFNGERQLILEQLISNESDKKDNENTNGYSHTIGGVKPKELEFAELHENLIQGIELSNYSSATNTLKPEGGGLFDIGFSYSIRKYTIDVTENFIGSYFITEKDFTNLPEKFDIGKIQIEK